MNLFGKRPLALFCAAFALAAILGAYLTSKGLHIHLPLALLSFFLSALLLAMPIFMKRFHPRQLTGCIALLFVALSLLESWIAIDRTIEQASSLGNETQSCTVRIKELERSTSYLSSYLVEIDSLGNSGAKTDGRLIFPFSADLEMGDQIEGNFYIKAATDDPENSSYLLSSGILVELEAETEDFSIIGHTPPDRLSTSILSLRNSLSEFICQHIDGEEGHLIASLFLNRRDLLSDKTARDFQRTGTTHLLAISGMHLSVIVLLTDLLLRFFGMTKNRRCVAILLITLFYLSLTGFALSACRAFLMCCFIYLSWLFHSDNDAVTSLFFALFFILLISPVSVYDIGMWMSVLAVLGILITLKFLESLREKLRKKGWDTKQIQRLLRPLSAICISLSAELFILYPMWLVFDELSLVALPCGILLSPLVTLILFLTPFFFFFAWLSPVVSLLGWTLYGIAHLILEGVSFLSRFRGITVSLGHRFFDIFIPIFFLIMLLLLILKLRRKWWIPATMGGALLSIALFLCFLRIPDTQTATADFLGQKDNALLTFTANEAIVVCDVTGGSYSAIGELRPLLAERCATEISAYVLTHYHKTHLNSLMRLFSTVVVRTLYLPIPQNQTEQEIFESLRDLSEKQNCAITLYERGTPLLFNELSLTVSSEAYLKRSTHPTFYLTATAFDKTLIYVGESLHEDEPLYTELYQKTATADLLIFGIHGPITKESFFYPLGDGRTVLTDPLLLDYITLGKAPTGSILCDTSQITVFFKRNTEE